MNHKNLNILLALTVLVLVVKTYSYQGESHFKNSCTIETIMSRGSVRNYLNKQVEDNKIDILIRAAMAAPSSKNRQPWSFVVVRNREMLDELGDNANNSSQAIVVCGDSTISSSWFLDCSAASENILLAAHAQGLGAVWTSGYPNRQRMSLIKETINLPNNLIPLSVIVFGYPSSPAVVKDKYNPNIIIYRD